MRHGMKDTFTYENQMDFNYPLLSPFNCTNRIIKK
jgi:hypothetical protein